MKKINLSLMKAHLSRNEMRIILGGGSGSGFAGGGCQHEEESTCATRCSSLQTDGSRVCDYCCVA